MYFRFGFGAFERTDVSLLSAFCSTFSEDLSFAVLASIFGENQKKIWGWATMSYNNTISDLSLVRVLS